MALLFAFGILYVIWGSTYLGIHFAIQTIPPLMMAGLRFSIAGALMNLWLRGRGTPAARAIEWRSAFIVGGCLFLIANGTICIAQKRVPSGLSALLVATVPLWMTLLDWIVFKGPRPNWRVIIGVVLGVAGIVVLVNPRTLIGQPIHLPGALAILASCIAWAVGSLYARRAPLPKSVFLATGMELLAGGVLLLLASVIKGEWATFDPRAISLVSIMSMLYLLFFGSIIAFSAYIWLLNTVSPAAVSTYAFVNPAVALGLGWMLGGERLALRELLAAGLIIAAVMLITIRRSAKSNKTNTRDHIHQAAVHAPARTAKTAEELCEV